MKFAIITHVVHKQVSENLYSAYGPYVKEMNLWFKHVDEISIVAPLCKNLPDKIDINYIKKTNLIEIKEINLIGIKNILTTLFYLPLIIYKIIKVISKSDHVHLRCPGNIGLIGCIVQIFFPGKRKTAKYAGNWDKNSYQPWSYRLQKWILNNTFITKNMKVMVYGNWKDSSKNVMPFFTASYSEELKFPLQNKVIDKKNIKLIFVGALNEGKRPLMSVEIAQQMINMGINTHLDIFGNGGQAGKIKEYINKNNLSEYITLHGNQSSEEVIKYYQKAHFLIFLSQSEGWPKVVAESMWWGCLPITTDVSCIPEILGNETRGSIIEPDKDIAVNTIMSYINEPQVYQQKVINGSEWSRQFTIEKFENAILGLLS